jgi:hypothetical protein
MISLRRIIIAWVIVWLLLILTLVAVDNLAGLRAVLVGGATVLAVLLWWEFGRVDPYVPTSPSY